MKKVKVGIVDDLRCQIHWQTHDHIEQPMRTAVIRGKLKSCGLYDKLYGISSRCVTNTELETVHTWQYIAHVNKICSSDFGGFVSDDPDLLVRSGSLISALVAAGGVIEGTKAVLNGKCEHVYCNVRPPGHHAFAYKGGGFCIFNNVALGVKESLKHPKINRVLIVDFDVHHGDGTESIFEDSPQVLYTSLHRSAPFYPGTGMKSDSSIINYPMQPGDGFLEYKTIFTEKLIPNVKKFNPDIVFISCGIDAHKDDPTNSKINLSSCDFGWMTRQLKNLGKPVVCVLEGGYNLDALGDSICKVVEELLKK